MSRAGSDISVTRTPTTSVGELFDSCGHLKKIALRLNDPELFGELALLRVRVGLLRTELMALAGLSLD